MNEFRVCSTCGYGRGFHVSFKMIDDKYGIILICPECGSSFDIQLLEERLNGINPVRGSDF